MRIENRVKDLKKNFLCVEDKNIKKSEKDITKIDEKVPAELKKEKSIIDLITTKFKITEEALVKSTGFEKDGSEFVLCCSLDTLITVGDDLIERKKKIARFLAAMVGLKPMDGFEGLLISQMISTYKSAMESFGRANNNKNSVDVCSKLQNQGIKLMRLYNQQLETLDKHRNKGRQKMTVEHVHVYKGGQAIVGTVNQEGGVNNEN
jgi:hypothetical protein